MDARILTPIAFGALSFVQPSSGRQVPEIARYNAPKRSFLRHIPRHIVRLSCCGATMVRLTARQRAVFGEKFLDLANYAAAGLVFGQFVSQQPVSWKVVLAGVTTWLVFAAISFTLTGEQ
jgi:hypothetical protein